MQGFAKEHIYLVNPYIHTNTFTFEGIIIILFLEVINYMLAVKQEVKDVIQGSYFIFNHYIIWFCSTQIESRK